jgi:hypothetical protein
MSIIAHMGHLANLRYYIYSYELTANSSFNEFIMKEWSKYNT